MATEESSPEHEKPGSTSAGVVESTSSRDVMTPSDDESTQRNDATTSPAPEPAAQEPQAAPRSPAEAFADLADGVGRVQREVGMIADFVRGTGARLQRSADELRFAGSEAAVSGLIRIHDLVYRQKRDLHENSETKNAIRITKMLLDAVEGELASVDVFVIEPSVDDDVDLKLMLTVSNELAPTLKPWKRGIANVVSCAYIHRSSVGDRILKKSEVVVWRGRSDIALDIGGERNLKNDAVQDLPPTGSNETTPALKPQRPSLAGLLFNKNDHRSSLDDRSLNQAEDTSHNPRDNAHDVNDGVSHEEVASSWDRSRDDVLGGGSPEPRGPSGDRPEQ
jgi:molecular chaperone GrpE (heat shock protein)